MNRKLNSLILFLSLVITQGYLQGQNATSKFEKVKELGGIEEYLYTKNGMNLLLVQDNSTPVVTVQIVYRVGSKHEVQGNTGSAHLLEHLLFKGTEKFNKRKGTSIDSKLNRIGAEMNATTWNDRTNYYETIPSDKIEIALEIEADRMRNSLLLKEDKEAEMTVVRNEFEIRESNPEGVLTKEIWSTAYMANTYHHSTLGWRSDIENMPIEVLRDFYNTYYWPDNATLTINGDFQKEDVFTLVDRYFGKIGKAPKSMPQPYTKEPKQYGPRRVVVKKPGQMGVINISYKIPGKSHKDMAALKVLADILGSGTSAILNKEFADTGLAYYGGASATSFQEVNLFSVGLGFDPASSHESLNKKLLERIEKLKKEGVVQTDVDRIISSRNTRTILSRDGSASIAKGLTDAIAGGDWTHFFTESEDLKKVTALDVKRIANTYLVEDQSTTGYFIPKMEGGNEMMSPSEGSNFIAPDSKYYYRHPEHTKEQYVQGEQKAENDNKSSSIKLKKDNELLKDNTFAREKIAGIDVITAKTGAKGFVTVSASFPIGSYFSSGGNEMVPNITTGLLSKGTTKNDKFQFSEKLEKLGVILSVYPGTYNVGINFKCLKKDMPEVIDLLAEKLRYPLFDVDEFNLLKEQYIPGALQGLSSTNQMGEIALLQSIYPKGHPNYATGIKTSVENIKKVTLEDVKAFHKKYFGPKGMHLVAVGDVDEKALKKALEKSFKNWKGGITNTITYEEPKATKAKVEVVTIPEKANAQLFMGQYTGLKRSNPDYIPFYVADHIFGGGFSGRLMRTVRDEAGLTYGIGSGHTGHTYSGGYWSVNASFAPELFQQGLDATKKELKLWYNKGISIQELADAKANLQGGFKVGLSTTASMARTVLSLVERGSAPEYIYQYSKDIDAVTLEQANNAIKKYLDIDNLVVIKSGSLDKEGKPLK